MDGFAFDRLARSIAADITRRRLLALLTRTSLTAAMETWLTPLSKAKPKTRPATSTMQARAAQGRGESLPGCEVRAAQAQEKEGARLYTGVSRADLCRAVWQRAEHVRASRRLRFLQLWWLPDLPDL